MGWQFFTQNGAVKETMAAPANNWYLPADTIVAAATRIISNILASGDTQPAWRVLGSGRQEWGPGGTSPPDTFFYRTNLSGVIGLQTTTGLYVGSMAAYPPAAGTGGVVLGPGGGFSSFRSAVGFVFNASVSGEAQSRFTFDTNGLMQWGPGNAAADTNLYRSAMGTLKSDGVLIADPQTSVASV